MTGWFRRLARDAPPEPQAQSSPVEDPDDRPEALLSRQWQMVQTVNRSAGRLPAEAVVVARSVLDVVRQVVQTSGERELDIRAVILLRGILDDYLPTTLSAYLALDPGIVDVSGPSGRTPRESLIEQLVTLENSGLDLLDATRGRDIDALLAQGNFLGTKFSRSDLDL
jgi:hypothetical protein